MTASGSAQSLGDMADALRELAEDAVAARLIDALVAQLVACQRPTSQPASPPTSDALASSSHQSPATPADSNGDIDSVAEASQVCRIGIVALDAFLQANVTGPTLPATAVDALERCFATTFRGSELTASDELRPPILKRLRRACLEHLEVDGVAPYAHIAHLELFCLARLVFLQSLRDLPDDVIHIASRHGEGRDRCRLSLIRLRIDVWHHKLLLQPSLGRPTAFTKGSQWTDVPSLTTRIVKSLESMLAQLPDDTGASTSIDWTREEAVEFYAEAANNLIILGHHDSAKAALARGAKANGLEYALSGALGKRTKFQEKSTSQLVVLAQNFGPEKVATPDHAENEASECKPESLKLDNDTLLESISFKTDEKVVDKADDLPPRLAQLSPDDQPQLSSLDHIFLLTEAALRDTFSPLDSLTSEEVLPFATRVLTDKSSNWQVYTHALLVRSRIELRRSRTVERGVLQLQAIADQVVADTSSSRPQHQPAALDAPKPDNGVPTIEITPAEETSETPQRKGISAFLPAPTASESAPASLRLRHIHALSSPPRWHLESELAYAWAGAGSLLSAIEIFKRLHLWAEVALCLATASAADDPDGRGAGGEEKAKAVIRWQLLRYSGHGPPTPPDPLEGDIEEVMLLKAADFAGPEHSPPPTDAPRLWCILGDLEDEPKHYERAWEISRHRFARAQKSLGEYHLRRKDWNQALETYRKATAINRLSSETWSRLGDISLRLSLFDEAAEAYNRAISCATDASGGEDAKTWSNLGSALWSLYCDAAASPSANTSDETTATADTYAIAQTNGSGTEPAQPGNPRGPSSLLSQSLAAYKRGASLARDNWRIWENVVTLASRMRPLRVADIVLALQNILRLRRAEAAVDADVLAALLQDVVLSADPGTDPGVHEPPRGSPQRLVARLIEHDLVPLITHRSELWALVARLRTWRRDRAGAIEASERAWRAAVGSSPAGTLSPGTAPAAPQADWTADPATWAEVVARTDELVSALENWGPGLEDGGAARWQSKARSTLRSVMGRGRERWEGSEGWETLEGLLAGLKAPQPPEGSC